MTLQNYRGKACMNLNTKERKCDLIPIFRDVGTASLRSFTSPRNYAGVIRLVRHARVDDAVCRHNARTLLPPCPRCYFLSIAGMIGEVLLPRGSSSAARRRPSLLFPNEFWLEMFNSTQILPHDSTQRLTRALALHHHRQFPPRPSRRRHSRLS